MAEWIKCGSIIAYPFDWQRPAKTEEWVYEYLLSKKVTSPFVEFVCFPWATLIDLLDRGQLEKAEPLINALKAIPSKKCSIRATACQHIRVELVANILYELEITDLFWAHKTIDYDKIGNVALHPLPLFPYAYYHSDRILKPLNQRKYLFSFVGAYDPGGYLSDIRKRIFLLRGLDNSYFYQTSQWHFEKRVYSNQIYGEELTQAEVLMEHTELHHYLDVLKDTVYSLCPSGAGPNTIRYWESLSLGCIPIILSDSWHKPKISGAWVDVKVPEKNMEDYLSKIKCISDKTNDWVDTFNASSMADDWLKFIVDDLFDEENLIELIDGRRG